MNLRPFRLLVASLATSLLAVSIARAAAAQPERNISPTLIGTNLWYGDPAPAVWAYTEAARTRVIRIGGHAYDKTVPSDETLIAWVKKIRAHGAEPIIQVSQYQPPEKAAALVKLFNKRRAAGAPIRVWNIGNEPWLQGGRGDFEPVAAKIAAYFKPIASAMKAVDSSIKIFGPDECGYFPKVYEPLFGGDADITGKVPGKNYSYCDGLSWHRYPQTDVEPGLAEINDFRERMEQVRALVDRVNAQHKRRGSNAVEWSLGEFNAKGGKQVHTFGNGQMFGAVYGYSMLYGAAYSASWSMFESSGNRGKTDFGGFDGASFTPRASYWHQRMFAESFTGLTIAATSPRENILIFAAQDKKRSRVSVMLLNLTPSATPLPFELRFDATVPSGDALVFNAPLGANRTYSGTLEGRSTQVLVFEKTTLKTTRYTADDFAAVRPPATTSSPAPFRLLR